VGAEVNFSTFASFGESPLLGALCFLRVVEVPPMYSSREDPKEAWRVLKDIAAKWMRIAEGDKPEVLGEKQVIREASSNMYKKEGGELELDSFVGPRTKAMLQAMSEFFTGLAHQDPEVVKFREEVLEGRFPLSPGEAHGLIASYAARILPFEKFAKWGIPIIGHCAEVLERADGENLTRSTIG